MRNGFVMNSNEFHLDRFLEAQAKSYATALRELRAGKKTSHWIWYVFPQLTGLGSSTNSTFYGITGLAEARAYLAHPILGQRLHQAIEAMRTHRPGDAASVLGEVDALKFRSCLTLFSVADSSAQIFVDALEHFFAGRRDLRTLALLGNP